MEGFKDHPLYCTHCGQGLTDRYGKPALQLYDKELFQKSNILKLIPCNSCLAPIADKYIECDGTLLLIDLILQYREAYRHVLFNGYYTSLVLRVALLALICDGYISWAALSEAGEFFEQEYQFYIMCSKALLALLSFLIVVLLPSLFTNRGASIVITVQGLLLAYSSRFFNLLALLWSSAPSQTEEKIPNLMWIFIYLLFFISSVRVHQVTQKSGWFESVILLTIGHIAFLGLINLDYILNIFHC